MKKLLAAMTVVLSTFLMTGCGGNENIGYVDQKKIITEAPQMVKIVEEGTKKAEEIENQAKAELEKNPDISDEDRTKMLTEFDRKMSGINQAYATQVQHKLDETLVEICKEKNVSIVLDNTDMSKILITGGMDLTADVIKKLQ